MFGPAVIALALRGTPYYVAMSAVSAAFLLAIMQLSANLHRIFMQAVVAREREAALAGQFDTALNNMPHGLCMFTRRRAARGDESSLQRDDEAAGRSRRMRAPSASDIVAACVQAGSISAASGTDHPLRNREFAGAATSSPPIPTWPAAGRCRGHSSRWPAAAPSCCSRTSPNGATPKPGLRIWRVMTN